MGVPVRDYLSLDKPISKRKLLSQSFTITQFESQYYNALKVSARVTDLESILLIDDVITKGSTITQAIYLLEKAKPDLIIVVAAAGQMIVVSAVRNERGFLASGTRQQ